jgi:RimJ/RimL family protein N-acetyltransferase
VIVINDPEAIKLIAPKVHVPYIDGVHKCVARKNDAGQILGGVIFTNYTGASIEIHVAGLAPNWCSRELLYTIFDYPFRFLKVKKLFGVVEEANTKALRFDKHVGFKEETRIEGVYPSGAAIVLAMTLDDCKFLW